MEDPGLATATKKSMGVQVYSARDALKEDFAGTMGKLADIGFEYIEAFGLDVEGKIYDMTAQEYRTIVEDTGLKLLSSHCSYFKAEEGQALLEAAVAAGVTYANRPQGATTGAWPGYQPFGGWKGSGNTGKGIASFYYLAQYMREQSQTSVE